MSPELSREQLEYSVSKAIDFLYHSQLPYGEFRTYASSEESLEKTFSFDSSPFVTSLVLYSISFIDNVRVREMTSKALDFLLDEVEGSGLWSYWSSRNSRHKLLPPDLDDTCCISHILMQNHRLLPSNTEIILANRNRDGQFYTWLVPRPTLGSKFAEEINRVLKPAALLPLLLSGSIDDVDGVVNANVLFYLGENENTKKTIDYLVDIVLNETEGNCSRFYIDRHSFYYMLSRAYFNGVLSLAKTKDSVISRIIPMQDNDGAFGNELLTALAACSSLNFGSRISLLSKAIRYLIRTQKKDGSWRRLPMFLGPAPYYGSEELTTAFCVEALGRYSLLLDK